MFKCNDQVYLFLSVVKAYCLIKLKLKWEILLELIKMAQLMCPLDVYQFNDSDKNGFCYYIYLYQQSICIYLFLYNRNLFSIYICSITIRIFIYLQAVKCTRKSISYIHIYVIIVLAFCYTSDVSQ